MAAREGIDLAQFFFAQPDEIDNPIHLLSKPFDSVRAPEERDIGPYAQVAVQRRDLRHVPDAPPGGFYVAPALFGPVDPASPLAQEEIFGPVLAMIPFDTEEEAVAIANDTPYGLACGIWSQDYRRAMNVSRRIKAGMAWINTYKVAEVNVPFGGVKQSGIGREGSRHGLEAFTELKYLCLDVA